MKPKAFFTDKKACVLLKKGINGKLPMCTGNRTAPEGAVSRFFPDLGKINRKRTALTTNAVSCVSIRCLCLLALAALAW